MPHRPTPRPIKRALSPTDTTVDAHQQQAIDVDGMPARASVGALPAAAVADDDGCEFHDDRNLAHQRHANTARRVNDGDE